MKVFSFDAETNGLWGQAFALAAVVRENGEEVAKFLGRCPIAEEINEWVAENVLPEMESIPVTHEDYEALLKDFAAFYLKHKQDADIVAHMPVPVKSTIILDMHTRGLIGDWDAPYPLYCPSALLKTGGYAPDSVDGYLSTKHIPVPPCDGGTHNPLYDSAAAALAWESLVYHKEEDPFV